MVLLGADATLLKEYQVIQKKDLELNKDISEANRFFQKTDSLPWIWMVGIQGQSEMTDWSKEGRFFIYIPNTLKSF